MSLGVIIKGPEGIVLAADSRLTLTALSGSRQISVSFDNARKVLNFQAPHRWVGVVTYGLGAIGLRSAYSFLPEFEASLPLERQSIERSARLLAQFFMNQFQSVTPSLPPEPPMIFFIAGFNQDEPYGRVYMVSIPTDPIPKEVYTNSFGIATGGQAEITHRLLRGYDERLLSVIRGQLSLSEEQTAALRRAFDQFQLYSCPNSNIAITGLRRPCNLLYSYHYPSSEPNRRPTRSWRVYRCGRDDEGRRLNSYKRKNSEARCCDFGLGTN